MADARNVLAPKFELVRTVDCISLLRDKTYLFRIYPRSLKFEVDYIEKDSSIEQEYNSILKQSSFSKKVYGVFGFIRLATLGYLVLIEEASLQGQLLKANIFKVEKLLFIPLRNDSSRLIPKED